MNTRLRGEHYGQRFLLANASDARATPIAAVLELDDGIAEVRER